jgi:hypothetical protein
MGIGHVKNLILYLWQLPQHLLALALIRLWKAVKDSGGVYRMNRAGIGISLGGYIILDNGYNETTVKHEQGHQRQSLYLGPLYLFAVGIPSAVFHNLWDRLFHRKWAAGDRVKWYYSRYPEAWADRLGGVKRW